MTVPFQPGAVLYVQSFGVRPEAVEVPQIQTRAPTSSDITGGAGIFPVGKKWVDQIGNATYELTSLTSAGGTLTANWQQSSGATGVIDSVVGTTNQISVSTSGTAATLSIPSTFIAPGSIASTTTVTGATGVTATNGNLTVSGTGGGLLLPVVTGSGAASGTVTCNGRVGSITFTSVSIAAGASLTLTMANTSINSSTTRVLYALSGATAGSALTVESVTPSAGTFAWVITNGTGATTSTANITFDFIVLN